MKFGVVGALVLFGINFAIGCSRSESIRVDSAGQPVGKYLVVSLFPEDDPFALAAKAIAKRHDAERLYVSAELEGLLEKLKQQSPDYVAFVVKPETLDINLVNQILKLSTQLDDDPFVDFAYGFITGRDADAAVKLVNAASSSTSDPKIAQFGVTSSQMPKSMKQQTAWPLRKGQVPVTAYLSRGETDKIRDNDFIQKSMPELEDAPILLLASHGYPDGLVGGPKANDLKGRDFGGSVALNIACYTGVTKTWFEDDWKTGKMRQREVAADESFCLRMIDAGVAGYIAYTCPRPAGPTMFGDALQIASTGETMGQHFRRHCNSVILAHLLEGNDTVEVKTLSDGAPMKLDRTAGETVMTMSTGGILIGDPAFRPFVAKPDANPITTEVFENNGTLTVDIKVGTPIFHFHAGEPVNYWEGSKPAFRLETVVPIDKRSVSKVRMVKNSLGEVPHRLVAAVEQHDGQRLLHLKAVFAQPPMNELQQLVRSGLSGTFEIETPTAAMDGQPKPIRNEVPSR